MKHVSEWCIAVIIVTLIAAILWFDLYLGRTDYEIKPHTETVELWGEW